LNEIAVWTNFYKYWLNRAAGRPYGVDIPDPAVSAGIGSPWEGTVPLLLIRYEDLLEKSNVCIGSMTTYCTDLIVLIPMRMPSFASSHE
jgi:hypothetical protein